MMLAGKYYVGDLCYVLHDRWNDFCDTTISRDKCLDGEMSLPDGTRFASYGTRWGDGVYADNYDNEYGVDAGLIGCIRVDDICESELKNLKSGQVFDFTEPFSTGSTDGVIHFANIEIDTN